MNKKLEYKILNKHLMAERNEGASYWNIVPNIFEVAKASCIWNAKESSKQFLPRICLSVNKYPHVEDWVCAFTCDNSPAEVSFKGRDQELAEEIKDIDFSKPYDADIVKSIRSKFSKTKTKTINVDSDLIIMGELGELDE